ncbi:MAG: methylmalonyl Co-A mutase-associated GTPase MeaB [Treponema sp.]|nr:methylmalonyl Co-A mutase-associated GTPase MeaB [Treponema sp.]
MSSTAFPVDKIRSGDARYIAKLISMVENELPERIGVLQALHNKAVLNHAGKAHVIGITGPPGSGKSTLTDKIVLELRRLGKKVAVLAVDPSSPFSGGAILGDRIRMQRHATDENVYIRSLATRGHLGGLSLAVAESVRVLDAAGFDTIIVETVGVGQSEVDIVRCADTILLVSVPGLGDDIQTIKAGVMEIGDIFVVNKADKDGAQRVVKEIRAMLETAVANGSKTRFSELFQTRADLKGAAAGTRAAAPLAVPPMDQGAFHHITSQAGAHPKLEIPPVLTTIAETGDGIRELVAETQNHGSDLEITGFKLQRRKENIAWELKDALSRQMFKGLETSEAADLLSTLAKSVTEAEIDFYDALDRLAKAMKLETRSF